MAALSFQVSGLNSGQNLTISGGSSSATISQNGSAQLQASAAATLSIAQQPSGETCEFEVETTQGSGTFASLTAGTSVQVAQMRNAIVSVSCSSYPALTPTLPQVGPGTSGNSQTPTPEVMPDPIITPVYFSNDPASAQGQETSFLQKLVASSLWSTLAQYGVGAASVTQPVVLSSSAASPFSRSTAANLLTTNAASWEGGTLDSRHFFVFFLPNGTTLDVAGAAAYHTGVYVGTNSTLVPFAIVPLPSDASNQIATEHEVMEGVADPSGYLGYAQLTGSDNYLWGPVIGNTGTEIGDMCEIYTTTEADLSSYILQPIWSNQAAAAAQDPCVPGSAISGGALFGAVPATSSIATLSGYLGSFQGSVVPAGKSVTLPMRLFASSTAVGPITLNAIVKAVYTNSGSSDLQGWSLHVDKQGLNGDTVNLTITAPADAGSGLYVVDMAAADSQGQVYFWPLAVSTTANYS